MKISDEIEKHSKEENKPILKWLFSKYHMQSNWYFVASGKIEGSYGQGTAKRVWSPTKEGIVLYNHRNEMES